jgi:2-polyprenyl-6-methoxyphenol hydroxylase-like FAD-dependent oxidoreductase
MNTIDPDKYSLPVKYGSEMRILIVGGGVSGLTLAALLQQRGFRPTLVERIPEYGKVGYIIVLWPSGSRILKGLGLYRDLLDAGLPFTKYNVWDETGEMLHSYSVNSVTEKYGPMISIYRPELINVLRKGVNPEHIRMNTYVREIEQTNDEAHVTFNDGAEETYDLVIGCDGVNSDTRRQIFGEVPLSKGRLSVFTSVRSPEGVPDPIENRIDNIRKNFNGFAGKVPEILSRLGDPREIFHTDYYDLRMDSWYKGRVVLVGDSAHAIMPTAGGGVSMAMESSAVMADELSRSDSKYINQAFEAYMSRRRARVDKIQNQSRMMGKVAYANSRVVSSLRNLVLRLYSNKIHLKYWETMLKEPI